MLIPHQVPFSNLLLIRHQVPFFNILSIWHQVPFRHLGRHGRATCRFIAILATLLVFTTPIGANELTFAVPGRVNSTPWIASADRFVAVAWAAVADGKGDIMVAISRDGGKGFDAPVRVNSTAGDARVSGEIAPRVTIHVRANGAPTITVTWNARDARTQVKTAQSIDGGKTFSERASLQATDAIGDRGWQASAVDGGGVVHAIWLDHRGMAAAKEHEGLKGGHDGVAMAQRSALYYAAAGGAERQLFKGVCYCCKTALAVGPSGHIYAAWRHVFANNMRDIAFTVSRDGGVTFAPMRRVHEDKWSINGCPDDGPAIAVERTGTMHLVWPTVLNGETGALLYATSKDGRRFTAPTRVPTLGAPKPSHPQIAVDAEGRAMIAWDEVIGGVRTAAARLLTIRNDRTEFGPIVTLADGAASYPVLAATPNGWRVAWSTGGPSSTIKSRLFR